VIGAGGLAGIIIAAIILVCGISWWQRKKLVQVAHRASTIIVKYGHEIRRSLK